MPLIHVTVGEAVGPETERELAVRCSAEVAEGLGKPESYVMTVISGEARILMGGTAGPGAFIDVRSIGGLSPDVTRDLSRRLCSLLREALDIPGDRIYINFADVDRPHWGWNGETF